MQSPSAPFCLLILSLLVASSHVSAAVLPDGEAVPKLEKDLFEVADILDNEEAAEAGEEEEEEEVVEKTSETDHRADVLVPAGWGSLRRRIGGAFRRVGDGIRRVFRGPWKICIPSCPKGGRRPRSWDA
ncbi:unnamed protein product [Hydatigera taeniaeformis]|uniref:Uncharacterized protein n=1 Tax=Hydatigena taeniaeformis TaxID=6205 RepID=A0A0R3WX61_HYDTA|nr:unnamed protein product [Hydatigera taeniaeformis]